MTGMSILGSERLSKQKRMEDTEVREKERKRENFLSEGVKLYGSKKKKKRTSDLVKKMRKKEREKTFW